MLAERCTLVSLAGIWLGEGAVLGERATLVDFEPGTQDVEVPIRLQPVAATPVIVGALARIGHGASLLRGVTIGPRALVGTHAVVTENVPADGRVGGVPARRAAP